MAYVIDDYSLLSQPEWVYLKELYVAIKPCEPALVVDSTPLQSEPTTTKIVYGVTITVSLLK